MDITHDSYTDCLDTLWGSHAEEEIEEEVKNFAVQLVRGVWENYEVINKKISEYATKLEELSQQKKTLSSSLNYLKTKILNQTN